MGYKIPVYEDRRTIKMASGNKLELHNVTSFDCSGSFLRLESHEGFSMINEANIDWMIVKNDPIKGYEDEYPTIPHDGFDMEDNIIVSASVSDKPVECTSEEGQITDEKPYTMPEPFLMHMMMMDEEESEENNTEEQPKEKVVDMVQVLLTNAANAETAEEALQWTQAAINVEILNGMRID